MKISLAQMELGTAPLRQREPAFVGAGSSGDPVPFSQSPLDRVPCRWKKSRTRPQKQSEQDDAKHETPRRSTSSRSAGAARRESPRALVRATAVRFPSILWFGVG